MNLLIDYDVIVVKGPLPTVLHDILNTSLEDLLPGLYS